MEPKVTAYLRESTADQDPGKFKLNILNYANMKGLLGKVEFVEEKVSGMKSWRKRKLYDVVQGLESGDVLLVPELSRVGRSLVEVLEVLNILAEKGVAVYSVKENFQLNGTDLQSKVMRTMLGLFAEIEHDLIVARTKEGLAARRAAGVRLGRPKGPGKSKLDKFKPEIEALLANGSTQIFIAKRYGCTPSTMHNWIKRNNIDVIELRRNE